MTFGEPADSIVGLGLIVTVIAARRALVPAPLRPVWWETFEWLLACIALIPAVRLLGLPWLAWPIWLVVALLWAVAAWKGLRYYR